MPESLVLTSAQTLPARDLSQSLIAEVLFRGLNNSFDIAAKLGETPIMKEAFNYFFQMSISPLQSQGLKSLSDSLSPLKRTGELILHHGEIS